MVWVSFWASEIKAPATIGSRRHFTAVTAGLGAAVKLGSRKNSGAKKLFVGCFCRPRDAFDTLAEVAHDSIVSFQRPRHEPDQRQKQWQHCVTYALQIGERMELFE